MSDWRARSFYPPEGHPGQLAYTFLIRILSTSFISVSIFSVCCFSRVSISMGMAFDQFFLFLLYRNCQRLHEFEEIEILRQSCRGDFDFCLVQEFGCWFFAVACKNWLHSPSPYQLAKSPDCILVFPLSMWEIDALPTKANGEVVVEPISSTISLNSFSLVFLVILCNKQRL